LVETEASGSSSAKESLTCSARSLVALEGENVVGLLGHDLGGDLALAPHGVQRHRGAGQN